jgi:putative hydrolase of the HAD superfamily
MVKNLSDFKYLTFDVVGTLIDFEGGLKASLTEIGQSIGMDVDGEEALALYRQARYSDDAGFFPDDLVRIYLAIAPKVGLPAERAHGEKLRDDARYWKAFPDSAMALARLGEHYRLVAMTNARRWAFDHFAKELGDPFYASFTVDDAGTEKPDPVFFQKVFAFVEGEGHTKDDILHVAQSQYHDIGISRRLGMTNCWIERLHAQKGYGGTIEPSEFTRPDYHFTSMVGLSEAARKAEFA